VAPAVTVAIPTFNRSSYLRETIASVLSQSFSDFRLVVGDNASDDDTPEVVASFADARIDYIRARRNIGMIPNFNRLIQHADTPLLVLLPDDDLLYPDYLRSVIDVLGLHPSVGAVHTAYDVIGGDSTVLSRGTNPLNSTRRLTIESTDDFLQRTLGSRPCDRPMVMFSSAIYRTKAIRDAGGLREQEEPFPDVPMWMRIALQWDFGFLSEPLVAFRVHENSVTANLGSFTGAGYDVPAHRILRDRRQGFLEDAGEQLEPEVRARYRALVDETFRADEIQRLAETAGLDTPWMSTTVSLLRLIRTDPRVLTVPRTWRLVAAQCGGRSIRRAFSWASLRLSAASGLKRART